MRKWTTHLLVGISVGVIVVAGPCGFAAGLPDWLDQPLGAEGSLGKVRTLGTILTDDLLPARESSLRLPEALNKPSVAAVVCWTWNLTEEPCWQCTARYEEDLKKANDIGWYKIEKYRKGGVLVVPVSKKDWENEAGRKKLMERIQNAAIPALLEETATRSEKAEPARAALIRKQIKLITTDWVDLKPTYDKESEQAKQLRAGEVRPTDNPREALNRIPGLGHTAAVLGNTFLKELTGLGEKDHVLLSVVDETIVEQYFSETIGKKFTEDESLDGTETLRLLKRFYAAKPTRRPLATFVPNDIINPRVPKNLHSRFRELAPGTLLLRTTSLEMMLPDTEQGIAPRLIIDYEGSIFSIGDPVKVLRKYLQALDDAGAIYLASEGLNRMEIETDDKGTKTKIREWLMSKTVLKVEDVPGWRDTTVLRIGIAEKFRGEKNRPTVLKNITVESDK